MNKHIIITPEQAEQIKGKYGKYSAIEPVPTPDGNYIIPENCLNDADLAAIKATLQALVTVDNVQDIVDLPKVGEPIEANRLYLYASEFSGLVKAVQAHTRTIYKPEETPALFSFFRENSDELGWIPNEWVKLGWKRVYNDIQYEVIQPHQTLSTWTPDATPALWVKVPGQEPIEEILPWHPFDGTNESLYQTGEKCIFEGHIWESKIDNNSWSPADYPAGWTNLGEAV